MAFVKTSGFLIFVDESKMPPIIVNLIGPIIVELNGARVIGFRSSKTLAILAYLVCERRVVSRNFLAHLFWPDKTYEEGRGHLRRALHDLSSHLPNSIEIDYHTVRFNPCHLLQADIYQLDLLVAAGDRCSRETAAALCRGELLEGLVLENCPDFDVWLLVERELWRIKAINLIETLLKEHSDAGNFDKAIFYAWQLLKFEPWREDIHYHLMVLLTKAGMPSLALKQYKICRKILLSELDIEPSTETTRLYTQIRRSVSMSSNNWPYHKNGLNGSMESVEKTWL